MTWEQLQAYLVGKTFLIGLNFFAKGGELIEQYQTHGIVDELTDEGLLRVRRNDGSVFQMPYDRETIQKAAKGEYREKATGEIVQDPDFLMTWDITVVKNDSLEDMKNHGYIPRRR